MCYSRSALWEAELPNLVREERAMGMGNRGFWALLWVFGIPLPVLVVAYFLFGGGCGAN